MDFSRVQVLNWVGKVPLASFPGKFLRAAAYSGMDTPPFTARQPNATGG
jgi:hypothetical protein